MPQAAKFKTSQIIDATTRIAARHGPSGATIARIARALRAPTGSIYYRFSSRSVLLGEVWLRAAEAFQAGFRVRLEQGEALAGGLAAVKFVAQWVGEHPEEARILLLYRRSEFLNESWPRALTDRAEVLRRDLQAGLEAFCDRAFGSHEPQQMRLATYALAEAPLAAVRSFIEADQPLPEITEALIEAVFLATITLGKPAE